MFQTWLMPKLLANKWLIIGLAGVIGIGATYSYGFYKGYTRYEQRLAKANERAFKAEQELARVAVENAARDAQRVAQAASRAQRDREEYRRAAPSTVDPVNCISNDQRMLIRSISAPRQ
jgi:hypothetical protein